MTKTKCSIMVDTKRHLPEFGSFFPLPKTALQITKNNYNFRIVTDKKNYLGQSFAYFFLNWEQFHKGYKKTCFG